ncbi:unnamed protein product [Pleuronectes platessa]|uniref:Uncharacterized protein n=1 Tax=Pleuronectes platessa TaxID=8262 RepID=A0A9N7YH30_PLEPL|nr:unnamed protein product [Pleuronectes platessa]
MCSDRHASQTVPTDSPSPSLPAPGSENGGKPSRAACLSLGSEVGLKAQSDLKTQGGLLATARDRQLLLDVRKAAEHHRSYHTGSTPPSLNAPPQVSHSHSPPHPPSSIVKNYHQEQPCPPTSPPSLVVVKEGMASSLAPARIPPRADKASVYSSLSLPVSGGVGDEEAWGGVSYQLEDRKMAESLVPELPVADKLSKLPTNPDQSEFTVSRQLLCVVLKDAIKEAQVAVETTVIQTQLLEQTEKSPELCAPPAEEDPHTTALTSLVFPQQEQQSTCNHFSQSSSTPLSRNRTVGQRLVDQRKKQVLQPKTGVKRIKLSNKIKLGPMTVSAVDHWESLKTDSFTDLSLPLGEERFGSSSVMPAELLLKPAIPLEFHITE